MRALDEDLRPCMRKHCEPATDHDCVVEALAWTEVVRFSRESQQLFVAGFAPAGALCG